MLSYRHGFHAGFWADVHKHTALALLLRHLRRKAKPFCLIDPFAGDGTYDLTAAEALKTGEFRDGIARLWRRTDAPPGADWYLEQVRALNASGELRAYPGSPALARAALRERDRLILGELHPTAHRRLKAWARGDPRIAVHRRDGLEFLIAAVPPRIPGIRRGVVLIDPSYEVKADYDRVPAALARALAKWPKGIYALWYPVLPEGRHSAMLATLAEVPAAGMLAAELAPAHPPPAGLRAAGIAIVNAPWRFDREMAWAGDWIAGALWPRGGRHRLDRLKGAEGATETDGQGRKRSWTA